MNHWGVLPDRPITASGPVSLAFLAGGITTFHQACRFVQELPYGYTTDRDSPLAVFAEGKGTCTTKHAAIATLAQELGLPVFKQVGIYAMTEEIVAGAGEILARFGLPHVPMLHCFLAHEEHRVDLTEGNRNGKRRPLEEFLFTARVAPALSEKEEYLLYRKVLGDIVLKDERFRGIDITTVLRAREEGLKLLKRNIAAAG